MNDNLLSEVTVYHQNQPFTWTTSFCKWPSSHVPFSPFDRSIPSDHVKLVSRKRSLLSWSPFTPR